MRFDEATASKILARDEHLERANLTGWMSRDGCSKKPPAVPAVDQHA
jgi:hypothetical protein